MINLDNEKLLFEKMFLEHLTDGKHYQLISQDNKVRTEITYENLWLDHLKKYDVYAGKIDSMVINPQIDYRIKEIQTKSIQKKIFRRPISGLDYLYILNSKNVHRQTFGLLKVMKISLAAADISSNPIANPTVLFDTGRRVHPGTNLVSAHQILKMKLKVIMNCPKNKTNKIRMYGKRYPINTLKEFANKFENIPMVFAEQSHWHAMCLHDRWSKTDPNGYVAPDRRFDVDRFLEIVRNTINSNNTFEITNLANKKIEIPNTHDVSELRNLFKKVYKADCFLD